MSCLLKSMELAAHAQIELGISYCPTSSFTSSPSGQFVHRQRTSYTPSCLSCQDHPLETMKKSSAPPTEEVAPPPSQTGRLEDSPSPAGHLEKEVTIFAPFGVWVVGSAFSIGSDGVQPATLKLRVSCFTVYAGREAMPWSVMTLNFYCCCALEHPSSSKETIGSRRNHVI